MLCLFMYQQSKMLVPGSNRRVFGIDKRASLAITGFVADGRQIVNRAREEADNYKIFSKIRKKKFIVGVIGLGYVGLPRSIQFCNKNKCCCCSKTQKAQQL